MREQKRLIAGTSIGRILALAIAYKISTENIVEIFKRKGKDIFKKQCSCFGVLKAKYNSDNLKVILDQWVKDKLIGDLECPVAIPAVN